ncbi:MAG: hypothetical protein NUV63_12200 [Gallionella sp.]|nr:hypothetical protein [Gallionella sp.]
MTALRQSDRRTRDASVVNDHRQSDRRISPAIGELAIQQNVELRAERNELLAALRDMVAIVEGVDEYQRHPDRGNPDTECACCMGEMFDMEEVDMVERARAAIKKATDHG